MREPRGRAPDRALLLYGIALLAGALVATIAVRPRPLLVWNASPSLPVGLYRIGPAHDLAVGEMVIANVPARYRALAAERHYLPFGVPLVKRVAAAPGDTICAIGERLSIDGRTAARRRARDGRGRCMPWWSGCTTLREGAVLLLADASASFDGRYFGSSARGEIIGTAWPLWTR